MREISSERKFQDVLDEAKTLILMDVWAPWCGPCRQMEPIIQELEEEYKDRLLIIKVNADDVPNLTAREGIRSLPTFIWYKDAQKV
ncbi:thioredoxin [Elysia marginata]|uniref:Thioredoxin n=1 Tax=Elysia marginata TaxID=1093978 RepID=A0AAV4JLS2_9GAST|nr:thioredoxin [Elysia marginata]